MTEAAGDVTVLLKRITGGDQDALGKLVPLVYNELRRLAEHYMRGEHPGHTLQPTAVVHEAYMRLAGLSRLDWQDRSHFMAVAAQMMRRILLNYARDRTAAKRTGGTVRADLDVENIGGLENAEEILAVDHAITRLADLNQEQSRVVELRYFGGLSVEETAHVLSVSPRTVKRHWSLAKAWLRAELSGHGLE